MTEFELYCKEVYTVYLSYIRHCGLRGAQARVQQEYHLGREVHTILAVGRDGSDWFVGPLQPYYGYCLYAG